MQKHISYLYKSSSFTSGEKLAFTRSFHPPQVTAITFILRSSFARINTNPFSILLRRQILHHLASMILLPTSRRWLLPALALLIVVLCYRSVIRVPASVKTIVRFRPYPQIQYGIKISPDIIEDQFMPHPDPSRGHVWPEQRYYYTYSSTTRADVNPYLESLLRCRHKPNPYTNHIRLPNLVQNVSQLTTSPDKSDDQERFNPTIIALPPWSSHQYLLVSRVVTEGFHQESVLCEADTCYSGQGLEDRRPGERDCTADDLAILGAAGGLRCMTAPQTVSIPPTPAEECTGSWSSFPDIPGFHDPRIFWSGKGEPLIMVNSASRYACVGLWIADLRTLHEPLKEMLMSQSGQPYHPGPLMSYPFLTELTRNPASTRASVEKNWFLFFPTPEEAYLHFDLSIPRQATDGNKTVGGRTFAKVIGNGFTTANLTDPFESLCLLDEPDNRGKHGHWHQTSNALKLILCRRAEAERGECSEAQEGRAVHFAVMHRKFSNDWDLPLRYERFFVVWDARPPFRMLAMSRYPTLMWNETASGWGGEENWAINDEYKDGDDSDDNDRKNNTQISVDDRRNTTKTDMPANESLHQPPTPPTLPKRTWNNTITPPPPSAPLPQHHETWAYFTYTPSISWSFRPSPAIRLREHENPPDDPQTNSANPNGEHTRTLEALNVGYLDDEVILGIGLDDRGQGVARVKVQDLLACLRRCPT